MTLFTEVSEMNAQALIGTAESLVADDKCQLDIPQIEETRSA
jgi:hypothetical protein